MIYKKKVLVVDGDPQSEKKFRPILESNYQCLFVERALEGLKIAEEWRPHIILLDLVLPNMSGLGFLRQIKRKAIVKTIPILIISEVDDFDVIQEALDLGADGFLAKTDSPRDLISMVRDYEPTNAPT